MLTFVFATSAALAGFATDTISATPGFGSIIDSGPTRFSTSLIDARLAALAQDADDAGCSAIEWSGTWVRGRSPRLSGLTEDGGVVSGPNITNGTVDAVGFSASLATGGALVGSTDIGNDLNGYFARINSARSIWYGVEVDCSPAVPEIEVSATAPTVDGADIANLFVGGFDAGGDQGHVWSNRPLQGQSFTTGSAPGGYVLHSVTMQNRSNNINNNSQPFTIRVGTVSGTTFSEIAAESSTNTISYSPSDFLTFHFATPVVLSPNTVYGFDWDAGGSGFISTNSHNTEYDGGEAFSHGGGGIGDDANLLFRDVDRVFHLDID